MFDRKMSMSSFVRRGCSIMGCMLMGLAAKAATIVEFHTNLTPNSQPAAICAGPDGNLWFIEAQANQIGTMTRSGGITEFAVPTANSGLISIVAGPDGNLWFTESNTTKIGRMTTAGAVTEFTLGITPNSTPYTIAAGPDGNLWFTKFFGGIGRISPTGSVMEFTLPTVGNPYGITAGPDGNIWFTETNSRKIGVCNTSGGGMTEYALVGGSSNPEAITSGPDGNLWFCEPFTARVGKISVHGAITEFDVASGPQGLVAGADGSMWVTTTNHILHLSTSGTFTAYPVPSAGNGLGAITRGSDNDFYFAEQGAFNGSSFVNGRLGRLIPTWEAKFVGKGGDGSDRVLWVNADGRAYVATTSPSGTTTHGPIYYTSGAVPQSFATANDNTSTIVWRKSDESTILWFMNASNARTSFVTIPPG